MASLVVESISTKTIADSTGTSSSQIVFTKPTGLAVGDLMVAIMVGWRQGDSWSTLSGWTEEAEIIDAEAATYNPFISLQTKIADSGDVAASTFSFTHSHGSAIKVAGAIFRISNPDPTNIPGAIDSDSSGTNTTSISFTTTLDPGTDNCLVISTIAAVATTSIPTLSSPTLTPSASLTNALNSDDSATEKTAIDISYFTQTNQAAFTAYAATAANTSINHAGILVAIRPNHPSSITLDTLTIGAAMQSTSNAVSVTSPTITVGAAMQAPTVAQATPDWTNKDKTAEGATTNKNKS